MNIAVRGLQVGCEEETRSMIEYMKGKMEAKAKKYKGR